MAPIFLDLEDILQIHAREIERSGGTPELRELGELEAAFLRINGFRIEENHPLELADLVLALLSGEKDREGIGEHLREHAVSEPW